ncbi:hypothetical protein BLNAU_14797 [Blattamonas nauphoetae]|uniref:Uncharacterized protein n=1 Tax=Blattamonas nauphoetae TaxID=2049346 RepID=A0ABQ9XJG6_9EUKA|nr:hypothetical protein BLNAU_14797 [Blattamonas nauphoetae]
MQFRALITSSCQSRTIHQSSPQFDPVNWFTQYATQDSSQSVQKQQTKTKNESTKLTLVSRASKHLGAINFAYTRQKAFLRGIEKGLTLNELRPIERGIVHRTPVSFPKTKASLCEMMSNTSDIDTITIPDTASYNRHEAEAYHPQWDFLFQRCLAQDSLTCFSPPNNADNTLDTNDEFATGKSSKPWTRLEVVTSQLVPNHQPNAVFDSMLLMLRFKKLSRELHSLGVFFLKSRTGSNYDMSDKGVHQASQVQTTKHRQAGFVHPKGEVDVGDIGIPAMTASTAPILARFVDLPANHNIHSVRCSFCGSLVAEDFPDHFYDAMSNTKPVIRLNRVVLDVLDHSNRTGIPSAEEHTQTNHWNQQTYCFTSTEIIYQETQLKPGKPRKRTQKNSQLPEPNSVKISVDLVSTPVDIQHKKSEQRIVANCAASFASNKLHSDHMFAAHRLWTEGCKLSLEQVGKCKYKPIKLAEQSYQSLEFDVPSVDITGTKHIEYESFWQSLNRKTLPAGLTENIKTCPNETEKSQLTCILAKGLLLRS